MCLRATKCKNADLYSDTLRIIIIPYDGLVQHLSQTAKWEDCFLKCFFQVFSGVYEEYFSVSYDVLQFCRAVGVWELLWQECLD